MVTLIYHSRAVGNVCRSIAAESGGIVAAHLDSSLSSEQLGGTVVRWGSLWKGAASVLEINKADAVARARDKQLTRLLLAGLAPSTWTNLSCLQYPCVIRPRHHFGGHKTYLCHDEGSARKAAISCGLGWYRISIFK
jgi:hypothetical protein